MIDGEAINAEAMQKLSAGEFQRAQRLFRFNCKRFPDDRSYNNYGHFLFENGITRKDGSVHCARGLAKHYYEKAFAIRQTGIVAGNLAYAASREQNYREAYDYLKTALTLPQCQSSEGAAQEWTQLNVWKNGSSVIATMTGSTTTGLRFTISIIPGGGENRSERYASGRQDI